MNNDRLLSSSVQCSCSEGKTGIKGYKASFLRGGRRQCQQFSCRFKRFHVWVCWTTAKVLYLMQGEIMYLFETFFFLHSVMWTNVLWLKWLRGYNGAHLHHCPANIILPLRPPLLTENTHSSDCGVSSFFFSSQENKKVFTCPVPHPVADSANKFLCWSNVESRGGKWSKYHLFPVILICDTLFMYRIKKSNAHKSVFVFYWLPVN